MKNVPEPERDFIEPHGVFKGSAMMTPGPEEGPMGDESWAGYISYEDCYSYDEFQACVLGDVRARYLDRADWEKRQKKKVGRGAPGRDGGD